MPNFTDDTIGRLSELSRISCSQEEQASLDQNLKMVLDYMDLLNEVDTSDVQPCYTVLGSVVNVSGKDEPGEPITHEAFLSRSPEHIGGMVKVPAVMDNGDESS